MSSTTRERIMYGSVCCVIAVLEAMIELFAHDDFIRPYFGDIIVMIGLYSLMRVFCPTGHKLLPLLALAVGFLVEAGQALAFGSGIGDPSLGVIVVLCVFDWADIACYVIGCVPCLIESVMRH